MECKDIREFLSSTMDGEASPEEARMVEEHLEGCAECRAAGKRMRALGVAVSRTEGTVPADFRERLFARMEKEDLLPKRRSIFVFSLRWAAVPLAAAAALALYVVSSREAPRDLSSTAVRPPQVARGVIGEEGKPPPAVSGVERELSAEEREIVAYLEVLEDFDLFDEPEGVDEMEIFAPPSRGRG